MSYMKHADKLLQLIEEGTSPYHTVSACINELKEAGFEELDLTKEWGLNNQKGYYIVHHSSALIAFYVGAHFGNTSTMRIAAAHTDFPCLCIKNNPDIKAGGYAQINVEIYGGCILNTWLDRPLSVAGRVALRSEDVFHPEVRLVDVKKPIMTIPNLAIHMNREVNKGVELNKQTDMLPIIGMMEEELNTQSYFLKYLAKEMHVLPEDILDYELYVYNTDTADLVGIEQEFISGPRLDNLTSVQALMSGLLDGKRDNGMNVIALFDHEEIGSNTKQGAASILLSSVLEKVYLSLGATTIQYKNALFGSMMLSVDVAHAFHPNQGSKSDLTNKNMLNSGFVIKEACTQSYVTDCEAIGIMQQICEEQDIPYQKFANRSDGAYGGTLGSIASTMLPIKMVDMGVPILAMHSARELMGVKDQTALVKAVTAFFALKQ